MRLFAICYDSTSLLDVDDELLLISDNYKNEILTLSIKIPCFTLTLSLSYTTIYEETKILLILSITIPCCAAGFLWYCCCVAPVVLLLQCSVGDFTFVNIIFAR